MSALPWQTSVSPQDIASGTANSFFLPAGGVIPPPPPPSTISSIADIQVSSITFGDISGSYPTGESLYRGSAAVGGGASSTIILTHSSVPAGVGSIYLDSLQVLGNPSTVFTSITNTLSTLNFNGNIINTNASPATCTTSSVTTGLVNNGPYVPQPLTRFGQDTIESGGSRLVLIPPYSTPYAVSLGGTSNLTVLNSPGSNSFVVGGPPGSNFSWFTVAVTQ